MSDSPPSPHTDERQTALTHDRLIGARLFLHTYLRLGLATIIVLGALFATYVVGIEDLDVKSLVGLAAVIAGYNAVAWFLTRQYREPEQSLAIHERLVGIMLTAIVLDFLSLAVAVWLVGGIRSPFLVFYMLHVILSCLLLTRKEALSLASLAYALMVTLALLELTGTLPPRQPVGAVGGHEPIDGRFVFTVLAVYGMLLTITVFLLLTLTGRLREGERRVRRANVELGRMAEMRRDFLHIALHNIQSPIGAVTMFLNNMDAGLGGALTEKQQHLISRSLKRLDGLNEFLQNFRTLNMLEYGSVDAQATDVDIVSMLGTLVDEHQEAAQAHGHTLTFEATSGLPPVQGIERLLREAVVNYITNAIKYTPDGGRIVVRAIHRAPVVRIEVEDNGIGIAEEDQGKLFNEFVRLNRPGTLVAKVQGSGLGLSLVKRVIESAGGTAFVESEPGKGSTFGIDLPALPGSLPVHGQ